jgi:hypothetical protein
VIRCDLHVDNLQTNRAGSSLYHQDRNRRDSRAVPG